MKIRSGPLRGPPGRGSAITATAANPSPPFHLFGPDHLAAVGLIAAAAGLMLGLRGRLSDQGRQRMGQVLAAGLGGYVLASYWFVWREGYLTWDYALPLHLCNILTLLALATLLRPTPWGSDIVYFWGVGGSVHALITPDLLWGFPSWAYIQFFLGHGLLILAAVQLAGVLGLHPRPEGLKRSFLGLVVYIPVVGTLDWIFGWNYGYLCQKPAGASLLDHLGPWPWYVVFGLVIAYASFWAVSLPWRPYWRRLETTSRSSSP